MSDTAWHKDLKPCPRCAASYERLDLMWKLVGEPLQAVFCMTCAMEGPWTYVGEGARDVLWQKTADGWNALNLEQL